MLVSSEVLAEALHRAHLRLLIDQIQQAAHAAHGEVAKHRRVGHQVDEGRFVEQEAEGVLGSQVCGTGRPLAHQRRHRKALADDDLEGGIGAALGGVRALTVHAAPA